MAISKTDFGTRKNGENVYCYKLDNGKGLAAEILSLGGIVKNIYVERPDGEKVDIVLGRNSLEEYENNEGYLGASVGRHANRIAKSEFELNGQIYHVGANENGNSLHGGFIGFDKKVWDVEEHDGEEPSIVLSLVSPDGDEGFPGTLKVQVIYTLTKYNSFNIHYIAESDKDTICNLTNHSYFNLNGHASGTVRNQVLQMNASFFTPNTDECMPTGEVWSVEGTPFDFREPKSIGQDIDSDYEQNKMFGGYDHNMIIEGRGFRTFASAVGLETGIVMEVKSDLPAVQLYTANCLEEGNYKNGAKYGKHCGFCLETQYFPNSMAHSHYPNPILRKGEKFDSVTEYIFTAK